MVHNPYTKLALWISFDRMKTRPDQRALQVATSAGPEKAMNHPPGFVGVDQQWIHFTFDDASHRAVVDSAKLPPLQGCRWKTGRRPVTPGQRPDLQTDRLGPAPTSSSLFNSAFSPSSSLTAAGFARVALWRSHSARISCVSPELRTPPSSSLRLLIVFLSRLAVPRILPAVMSVSVIFATRISCMSNR